MTISMDSTAFDSLFAGAVLRPGDIGYDEARTVWNGRFDSRPDAIVRCADEGDVVVAVNFARTNAVPLTIKAGGHDYAGNSASDGGLLIDLALMNGVEVDPAARRATVGPGATWGDVDEATQAFGLATTGGSVSTVGVAGHTLGGGTGFLARKHGIAADNLVSARVVTADGDVVTASADANPDLFWGLRGGGGNLGVVTSLEFGLHELGPEMMAGQIIYPLDRAAEFLRFFRDYMTDAPDELACYAFFFRVPPIEPFPEQYHGQVVFDFVVAFAGPIAAGEAALAPLRTIGDPILDFVAPLPYTAVQRSFDDGVPKGLRWYSRALYLDVLSDGAIDTTVRHVAEMKGPFTMVYYEPQGGAVNRVASSATAFPHRSAACQLHIFPGWEDPAEDQASMAWARSFCDAMEPYGNGGVYVNLLAEDESERVPAAYLDNHARLVRLKNEWDPDNLFRRNHNVEPRA